MHIRSLFRPVLLSLTLLGGVGGSVGPALAADPGGVSGSVLSSDGHGISHAVVTFSGAGPARTTVSDARGTFSLSELPTGTYTVAVQANGYSPIRDATVAVKPDGSTTIQFRLEREQTASLVTIGHVVANGSQTLSTAAVPSVNVDARAAAAQGVTRVSDMLSDELSTTVYPILGGGLNAPAVVALRGPDASETLVDVDGHQVNNGSTGDFDLSLLDPSDLQNVQVVYGIAPSALYGPNTLGGALNVVTLEPTTTPHMLERLSFGSYDTTQGTLQATGTDQRWGYALSLHKVTSGGELNDSPFANTNQSNESSPGCPLNCALLPSVGTSPIGNDLDADSSIAKLRYSFTNGGFISLSFRNQSVFRDLSATLSSEESIADEDPPVAGNPANTSPDYLNYSGSSVSSYNDAYGLDLDLPLGQRSADGYSATTAIFRHQTSLESQSVDGAAAGSSPYLYNDRDSIADDTLEIDHQLPHGTLSIKGAITGESLTTDNIIGVIYAADENRADALNVTPQDSVFNNNPTATVQQLQQTQRWIGARYTLDPTSHLHYSFASYYSDYSSFGHSVDPRFGFVWTPDASSSLRLSVGTTFQSPQLPTFIVPAANQNIPIVNGYAAIGDAGATAERSTEYDLGYEHLFHFAKHRLHSSLDFYRTDLHNGVASYLGPNNCVATSGGIYITLAQAEQQNCLTYPVNVTREVYQGLELRNTLALAAKTNLTLDYDIDSVFTKSLPGDVSSQAAFEQSIGVPLHKIALDIETNPSARFSYYGGILYEGQFNEQDLPPYATLRAGVSWHAKNFNLTLAGENLTNVYDFKYTQQNAGTIYSTGATPAYPLAGRQVTLILTHQI